MLSNPSLRTRIAYDIAVRYATPLWRVEAVFRAACVGGLWVLESVGIVLALLLYGGPLSARPLPVPVYLIGLVLITAHVWSA